MFLTALILGFTGSLHCLGMCSPLAMTVTGRSGDFTKRLLYNAGRILTYGVAGLIVASVGFALIFFQLQNILTIILGIVLVVAGFSGISRIKVPLLAAAMATFVSWLRNYFGVFIQRKSHMSVFFLGALNGLLPCGLSVIALSFCLSFDTPQQGFYFMFLFGVGTLPVMLGATGIYQWIIARINVSFSRVSMAMLILSGVLLIGRVFVHHEPHSQEPRHDLVDIVLCR